MCLHTSRAMSTLYPHSDHRSHLHVQRSRFQFAGVWVDRSTRNTLVLGRLASFFVSTAVLRSSSLLGVPSYHHSLFLVLIATVFLMYFQCHFDIHAWMVVRDILATSSSALTSIPVYSYRSKRHLTSLACRFVSQAHGLVASGLNPQVDKDDTMTRHDAILTHFRRQFLGTKSRINPIH